MPPADSQGNGESQSGSGDPGGGGASVEPVRKAVQLLLVHIPDGIGHGEAKLSLLLLQNQPDAPAGRAVAEGIVQQNGYQLPQGFFVTGAAQTLLDGESEGDIPALCQASVGGSHILCQIGDGKLDKASLADAFITPGQVHKILGHVRQPLGL